MCLLATSSSSAPLLELPVQAGVDDGQRGLAGERLEQVAGLVGEAPGDQAANGEGADNAVVTEDRHRDERPPAGVDQDADVGIRRHVPHVGYLLRLALLGRPADDRVVQTDPCAPQTSLRTDVLVPNWVRTRNSSARSSYSKMEPPSAAESCTALMMIVARTSSGSRLELTAWPMLPSASSWSTFRRQVLLPGVQGPHQVHVADGDRGLGGERRQHLRRPVGEGVHLGPPGREHADDLSVEEHRHTEDGAVAADPLDIVHGVLGVVEDVGDLLGPPIEADPADEAPPVEGDRVVEGGSPGTRRSARRPRPSGRCRPRARWIWATSAWQSRRALSTTVPRTESRSAAARPTAVSTWSVAMSWARASSRSCVSRSNSVDGEPPLGAVIAPPPG